MNAATTAIQKPKIVTLEFSGFHKGFKNGFLVRVGTSLSEDAFKSMRGIASITRILPLSDKGVSPCMFQVIHNGTISDDTIKELIRMDIEA